MDESDKTEGPHGVTLLLGGSGSTALDRRDLYERILQAINLDSKPLARHYLPRALFSESFDYLDLLHPRDLRPFRRITSRHNGISLVAKTVWTLWAEEPQKVWALLLEWGVGTDILMTACGEIVKVGFEENRFSPEEAFREVEQWLIKEDYSHHQAAAHLLQVILPEITHESLFELTSGWKPEEMGKPAYGFAGAMQQIFYRDPVRALKMLLQWSRGEHQSKYDYLIAKTLEGVVPIPDAGKDYYLSIERLLIQLIMSNHNEDVRKAANRLTKAVRDCRSKTMNQGAHKRSLQQVKNKQGKWL